MKYLEAYCPPRFPIDKCWPNPLHRSMYMSFTVVALLKYFRCGEVVICDEMTWNEVYCAHIIYHTPIQILRVSITWSNIEYEVSRVWFINNIQSLPVLANSQNMCFSQLLWLCILDVLQTFKRIKGLYAATIHTNVHIYIKVNVTLYCHFWKFS